MEETKTLLYQQLHTKGNFYVMRARAPGARCSSARQHNERTLYIDFFSLDFLKRKNDVL